MPVSQKISIPGKTFLAGEYLVLQGGSALVAMTSPRFEMKLEPGTGVVEGIHPKSPAGEFLAHHSDFKNKYNFTFQDPYKIGGFGASTAQFLAVYRAWQPDGMEGRTLLKSYRECAWKGKGFSPSGADVMGQFMGGLSFFDSRTLQMRKAEWAFPNLKFTLISTGQKLATHTHLLDLPGFEEAKLRQAFVKIEKGLMGTESPAEREALFIEGIRDYALALQEQKLTTEHSLEILTELNRIAGVKAVKACGAMGADVIAIFTEGEPTQDLNLYLQARELKKIATEKDLAEGLRTVKEEGI